MPFVPDEPSKGRFVPDAAPPPPAAPASAEQPGLLERALPYMDPRGPFEAAAGVASGMAGQAVGGLAGLAGAALPGPAGQGADVAERVASALTYSPRGKAGQALEKAASLPGVAVSKVAEKVGERGAQFSPLVGALGKGSTEVLPLLLGARSALSKAGKGPLTPKQKEAAAARDAGVKLTPEEMGAGPVSRGAASIAGEPRLAKLISKKNQPVWNEKIAQDLGLEKDTRLSREVTEEVRSQEGKAYAAMRKAGQVEADQQYRLDLKATVLDLEGAAADFEHRATSPLRTVVESLSKKSSFDANSAVSEIINLRNDAKKAFKQGDNELGRGSLQAAEALENLLDRHVAKISQLGQMDEGAMSAFRAARVRIAKAYAADRAMDPATGDINPQAYAKMLQQKVPLTGEAKFVGETAQAFPRSAQNTRNLGATGPTIWDALTAWGTRELPMLFARPGARGALASGPGQALMDPRTNVGPAAMQAMGVGSLPPPQKESR